MVRLVVVDTTCRIPWYTTWNKTSTHWRVQTVAAAVFKLLNCSHLQSFRYRVTDLPIETDVAQLYILVCDKFQVWNNFRLTWNCYHLKGWWSRKKKIKMLIKLALKAMTLMVKRRKKVFLLLISAAQESQLTKGGMKVSRLNQDWKITFYSLSLLNKDKFVSWHTRLIQIRFIY